MALVATGALAPVSPASAATTSFSSNSAFVSTGGTGLTTTTVSLAKASDLLVIWVKAKFVANPTPIRVTSISASGTGAIGTPVMAYQYYTVDHPSNDDEIWYAPVRTAGNITLTFTWFASNSNYLSEYSTQEFQPSAPSSFSLDTTGNYEGATPTLTMQFPTLTPAAAGELYVGYNSNGTTGSYTTPTSPGYLVYPTSDQDAIVVNPNVVAAPQSPITTASNQASTQSSIGALFIATPLSQFTVTFYGNTSTSGSMSLESASTATALTPNSFLKTGYTFAGWNTAPDGSGSGYADGATYPFTSNTPLYAQWTADYFNVTFLGNGATSGAMSVESHNSTTALTLNAFTRTGYTFAGWNTAPDGSGTSSYADGANYLFTAPATLYAQWTPGVTFVGNGATSGTMGAESGNGPTTLTLNAFTRTGYSFAGWNTAADGLGASYGDRAIYPFNGPATLYAQWIPIVSFSGNGSTGGTMSAETANIPTALLLNIFTRTGYTFAGWNTAANGSGNSYSDAVSYPFSAPATLYAQWTAENHKVIFHGNGATSGSMKAEIRSSPAGLTNNVITRTGYTFTAWNTAADGTGTNYANRAIFRFNSNIILYAQWKAANYSVYFHANGATTGIMKVETNNSPTALRANAFGRPGYTFAGWNTAVNGQGTKYADRASFAFIKGVTLYAQWASIVPHAARIIGSVSVGQVRTLTIVGTGLLFGSKVTSNERGTAVRVLKIGVTEIKLSVTADWWSPIGRFFFTIVTTSNKTCTIGYTAEP